MDLYSAVFKWAYRQGENFTTDSFCFLLNEMLRDETDLALEFLNWLCFETEVIFVAGDVLEISTQIRSSDGIPDIVIRSESSFVIIEVKKGSDLHSGQLAQYHRLLENKRQETKVLRTQLVLLTAFQANYEEAEKPNRKPLRWSEVEQKLTTLPIKHEVIQYLVSQFVSFLKAQIMTSEQVNWQLVEGTKSLVSLVDMLGQALQNLSIGTHQASSGWNYRGYYTTGKLYWVGVTLDSPGFIRFEFSEAKPDTNALTAQGWELREKTVTKSLELESEQCHFFARAKEQQLDEIQRFLETAHREADANRSTR